MIRKNKLTHDLLKRLKPLLNHFSLLTLSLLSLLTLVLIQPGYAKNLSQTSDWKIEQFMTSGISIGINVIFFVVLIISTIYVTFKVFLDKESRDRLVEDLSLWVLFGLGIALLPLLAEGLISGKSKTFIGLVQTLFMSHDILIVTVALIGASVGELVAIGRTRKISHWYTLLMGMGVISVTLTTLMFGYLENPVQAYYYPDVQTSIMENISDSFVSNDIQSIGIPENINTPVDATAIQNRETISSALKKSVAPWSVRMFLFSCIYTVLAKAIRADEEDSQTV